MDIVFAASDSDREAARCYALPDRWLAEYLLRLAREVRGAVQGAAGNPASDDPAPNFLWHVVPEAARRLGASRLSANEATRQEVRGALPEDLRSAVAAYIKHGGMRELARSLPAAPARAAAALGRYPEDGNPLACAMDRLSPLREPPAKDGDWMARRVLDAARRRGHPDAAAWHPGLMEPAPPPEGQVIRPEFGDGRLTAKE